MSKYEIEVIPKLVGLKTNVKLIPHFPLVATIPETSSDINARINAEYLVKKIPNFSKGKVKAKSYQKIEDNTIYFECPVGFGLVAKLLLKNEKNRFQIIVNSLYHKIGRASIDKLYSPGWHLLDMIQYKLLEKDYTLLHSASFFYGDTGILLIGLSNTGKTSTTLSFVEQGGKFVAEDMSVTNGRKIFSCPYTLSYINIDLKKLNIIKRISNSIYRKMCSVFPVLDHFLKGPIKSIYDVVDSEKVCLEGKVDYIFILSRGRKFIQAIEPDKACSYILASNRMEFPYHNDPLLLAAQFLDSGINVFEAMEKEVDLINSLVNNAELYYLSGDLDYFIKSIYNIIKK